MKKTPPKKRTQKKAAAAPKKRSAVSKPASGKTKDAVDWRSETLARARSIIMAADPGMVEVRKWKKPSNPAGVPVFEHDGIICTGETYKAAVKLTFAYDRFNSIKFFECRLYFESWLNQTTQNRRISTTGKIIQ